MSSKVIFIKNIKNVKDISDHVKEHGISVSKKLINNLINGKNMESSNS